MDKHLAVLDFLRQYELERSLLIGFYGGGNYGDELLLEVLQNLLKNRGVLDITIAYKNPKAFKTYHHDFGYQIAGWRLGALTRALLNSKQVVVGGGGLWGLDSSFKILAFGVLLFGARWIFRKKVYLVGVGYYGSASGLGRLSAWLAGKAANLIIGRDIETINNFSRIQPNTYLDKDMAWYTSLIDLKPYESELKQMEKSIKLRNKTICIILRRFSSKHANSFNDRVEEFIQQKPKQQILVTLMEPREAFPEGHDLIRRWQEKYPFIQTMESAHNPLVLFLLFGKHHARLALVAPQFHAIITAHLSGVPFLPVVYDNKVARLLEQIDNRNHIPIHELELGHMQSFAEDQT